MIKDILTLTIIMSVVILILTIILDLYIFRREKNHERDQDLCGRVAESDFVRNRRPRKRS